MYELPPNIPSRQIMLSQAARRQVDTWKQLQMAEEELPAKRCDLIVSHETAASLMGVTLFRRSRKIHITVGRRKDRIHRKPFVCHVLGNTSLESSQARIFTVPCASPEATFAQLSRTLKLEDLVLLGDSLTCRNPFLKRTSKARLNRYLHECDSFRGLPQCRRALRLIQEDTDSPQETLLRLRMLQYGLPCLTSISVWMRSAADTSSTWLIRRHGSAWSTTDATITSSRLRTGTARTP